MGQECRRCRLPLDWEEFRRRRGGRGRSDVCRACELQAELKGIFSRRRRKRDAELARAQAGRAVLGEREEPCG